MSIGSTIKELRLKYNMTQEVLAEKLGITSNSISQWECDRTSPDISQLPILARIFNCTSDYLLGIDVTNDEKIIDDIITESFEYYKGGELSKAVETARNGLAKYPNSYRLMARLADTLRCHANMYDYSPQDEIEILCKRILKYCTETKPRDMANRTLVLYYIRTNKKDKAEEIINNMSSVIATKEEILLETFDYNSEEDKLKLRDFATYSLLRLCRCLNKLAGCLSYSIEERIELCNQTIKIIETLYPNHDYSVDDFAYLADSHFMIAALYCAASNKDDIVLEHLEKMLLYIEQCDKCEPFTHTSPAFKGYTASGWNNSEKSYAKLTLPLIDHGIDFKPFWDDVRFIKIVERLKQLAE